MCHAINKRRVCACVAAMVVALTSLLCSTPTGAAEPIMSWWSTTEFPYTAGESTLTDIKDVQVFVGYENLRYGSGSTVATASPLAYAWYQCYEGLDYDTYGYPSVYVRVGGEWVDVGGYTPMYSTSEYGFDFQISFYDGEECKDGDTDSGDNYLTYSQHFQNVLTGTYGNARTCYWGNAFVYAVRWTAKTGNTVQKFCYFGVPHSEDDGIVTNSGYYIGNRIHPAQASYWGGEAMAQDYEREIADLEADLEAAESAYNQALVDKKIEVDKAYNNGYNAGYEKGSIEGGAETVYVSHDYIIDDSSWQSSVISFISVLFIGVRDFFAPFFAIEFFGVSVKTALATIIFGGMVVGIVLLVLKFKG